MKIDAEKELVNIDAKKICKSVEEIIKLQLNMLVPYVKSTSIKYTLNLVIFINPFWNK